MIQLTQFNSIYNVTNGVFCFLSVDWVPVVRDVVNLGVTTLNLFLSISLSLTIIAMGWIWYRPWLGIGIIVMAALPFILSRRRAVDATNRRSYTHGNTYRDW